MVSLGRSNEPAADDSISRAPSAWADTAADHSAMGQAPQSTMAYLTAGFVLLLAIVTGLLYYKWGGAIGTVSAVRGSGEWTRPAAGLTMGGALQATIYYFQRIWLALVYGILIGAAVRAFVPIRAVVAFLGRGGAVRQQVAAAVAGAPLMLCSCCITPVFSSVYERGARLRTALSVMLASPGLNPAALILTFVLFPSRIAIVRLVAALAAVLVLPVVVEYTVGESVPIRGELEPVTPDVLPLDFTVRGLGARFGRSVVYLTAVTVPLLVVGIFVSSLLLPFALGGGTRGAASTVVLVGTTATLVALPTFFEIPLALFLLHLGAPGAAAAMLVAGPVINLPSLLVLARSTRWQVALAVAAGVWLLGMGAGAAAM